MISTSFAGNALLLIFGLLLIFHLLVLSGLIPSNIVWAGKITNRKELIRMESISILMLLIVALIVAIKMKYLSLGISPTIVNVGVWIVFGLFCLNTLGNMTAKSPFEKYGFGLLTLMISLLALRLAIGP